MVDNGDSLVLSDDDLCLDINSVQEEAKEIDWDEIHDDEDGESPVSEITLKVEDFSPTIEIVDPILEDVRRVVALHKAQGLGGHLVPSDLKRYTVLSVEELEERLKMNGK